MPSLAATLQSRPMQSPRSQFIADVTANIPLCREHYRLSLRLDSFPSSRPGQFVQVASDEPANGDGPEIEWTEGTFPKLRGPELFEPRGFLRRPFSLGGRRDDGRGVELDLIYRVVGLSTHRLLRLKQGDQLNILGPLGNGFTPPAKDGLAILVGGGVGIPPMIYFAAELAGCRAVAFCGTVNRDLLPLTVTADAPPPANGDSVEPLYNIDEFARHGIPAIISTDDGSYGYRGFVTQALEAYLDRYIVGQGDAVARTIIYTCGPEVMMKRVAEIALRRGISCQVSVERAMACGMGTCQSCCIKVKKPDPAKPPLAGSPWCYRLSCTDGPVFDAADLLW